jgi:hypothetical protein
MNRRRSACKVTHAFFLSFAGAALVAMSCNAHALDARVRANLEISETTWVGQRVMLNIDLMTDGVRFGGQRIRLPEVPGALILEDSVSTIRLNEEIDSKSWQVLRFRYPMFVQRAGRIELPEISVEFNAYESFVGDPVAFARTADPMSLDVQTPPGVTRPDRLVTTGDFSLAVTIDPEIGDLSVGDAFTRVVTRSATDVSGMAFAPIVADDVPGVAAYLKAPDIDDRSNRGTMTGTRVDTTSYVLEQAGEFEIPELELEWWDPVRAQLHTEIVPALNLVVAENPVVNSDSATPAATTRPEFDPGKILLTAAAAVVLLLLARILFSRIHGWREQQKVDYLNSEPGRFNCLVRACSRNDSAQAYAEFHRWRRFTGDQQGRYHADEGVVAELNRLQLALIQKDSKWQGRSLAAALRSFRGKMLAEPASSRSSALPALNPG